MIIFLILALFVALLLRSRDFFYNPIPLGYDPGLYKEMFIQYYELGNNRNFLLLPKWIQSMYEPGLGMIGSIYQHLTLPFTDIWLTRGWLVVSLFLMLATYTLTKKLNKETAILASILVGLSFIQYSVFRRAYRKQTVGISLVLIIISLRSDRKIRHSIPLLILVGISNRASLLRIGCIGIVLFIRILFTKQCNNKKDVLVSLGLVGFISGIGILSILWPFIHDQILSMIKPFITSIDTPNYNETYQASGTFLTTKEYFTTSWFTIITGIIGLGLLIKKRFSGSTNTYYKVNTDTSNICSISDTCDLSLLGIATITMLIRVFGQFFFFQRMIGYLDVMICICSAYTLIQLKGSWRGWIVGLFLIINSITTFYRWRIIHPPLINTEEFISIREFGRATTKDDVIISPGFWYSPWIQGWTSGEVIAPGLFDLGRWGDASQGRESKWYNQSPEIKCTNLESDYPELSGKHIYLWIGSKQGQENFSGACFMFITGDANLNYYRYRIQF